MLFRNWVAVVLIFILCCETHRQFVKKVSTVYVGLVTCRCFHRNSSDVLISNVCNYRCMSCSVRLLNLHDMSECGGRRERDRKRD